MRKIKEKGIKSRLKGKKATLDYQENLTKGKPEILVKKDSESLKKCKKICLGSEVILLEPTETDGRGRDLQPEKEIFARWKVMPRGQKEPKTLEKLAECLSVSYQTLWVWSKDSRLVNMIKIHRHNYLSGFTSEVLNALKKRCQKFGRAQDVKLWLKYVEGWIPKQE